MKRLSLAERLMYIIMIGLAIGAIIGFIFDKNYVAMMWTFNVILWVIYHLILNLNYTDLKESYNHISKKYDEVLNLADSVHQDNKKVLKHASDVCNLNKEITEDLRLYYDRIVEIGTELGRIDPDNPVLQKVIDDIKRVRSEREAKKAESKIIIDTIEKDINKV
jgi:hypothetical protein